MNFFVKKTVLVAVVLGLIGTVYAPVYSPGVAERIIKNALVEVKKTGTIKDVVQFKQAYQDLPRMSKEDYQDDYESILKAAQKAVMQKKPIVVPVKIDTVPEPKPKESISKKTENEKKLEVYLSELERIKEKERKGQELLEQERIKKEQLDKQRQEQERQKEEDRIKSEKQEKEKIERQLEEVKRQQEALDKQLQLQEKDNQEPLKKEKQEQNKQLNDQEKIQKEQNEKDRLEQQQLREKTLKEKQQKLKEQQEELETKRIYQQQLKEQERKEKEKQEKERLEKEQQEKLRLEKERIEKENQEKERFEKIRLEAEQLQKEIEKEQQEKLRLEKERVEKEKQQKLEQERLEKEKVEKERLEQERDRVERERQLEDERVKKELDKVNELANKAGNDEMPELEDEDEKAPESKSKKNLSSTKEQAEEESKKCSNVKSVIVHNSLTKNVHVGLYQLNMNNKKMGSTMIRIMSFNLLEIPAESYKSVCITTNVLTNYNLLVLDDKGSFSPNYASKKINEFKNRGCLIALNNNDYISHKKIIEVKNTMVSNNKNK